MCFAVAVVVVLLLVLRWCSGGGGGVCGSSVKGVVMVVVSGGDVRGSSVKHVVVVEVSGGDVGGSSVKGVAQLRQTNVWQCTATPDCLLRRWKRLFIALFPAEVNVTDGTPVLRKHKVPGLFSIVLARCRSL